MRKKCTTCKTRGMICSDCGEPKDDCFCVPVEDLMEQYVMPRMIECPSCGGWGFIETVD